MKYFLILGYLCNGQPNVAAEYPSMKDAIAAYFEHDGTNSHGEITVLERSDNGTESHWGFGIPRDQGPTPSVIYLDKSCVNGPGV